MKRALGLVLLGLFAYLAFLVATFPAGWAYALAKPQLQRAGIALYQIEGTVWAGRVGRPEVRGHRLPPLDWRLRPLALLTLEGRADLALGGDRLRTTLTIDRNGGLRLAPLTLHWPVPEILELARLDALQLGGRLDARLEHLRIDAGLPRAAEGTLTWSAASTRLPVETHLGDLSLELTTTEQGIEGRFRDGGGPLGLSGTLALDPQGAWRLSLRLTPREGRQSDLGRLLAFLGRPDGQGRVTLQRSGRLSPWR